MCTQNLFKILFNPLTRQYRMVPVNSNNFKSPWINVFEGFESQCKAELKKLIKTV